MRHLMARARTWARRTAAGGAALLHRTSSAAGETLAEVVIAIAIVGIVSVGMFSAISSATYAANALTRQDRVRNELVNAVATIQNAPYAPSYTLPDSKGVQFAVQVTDQPTSNFQSIRITATFQTDSLFQIVFKEQR